MKPQWKSPTPRPPTVLQTTLGTLAAALEPRLAYYSQQGLRMEEMEVVLTIRGKNRVVSWALCPTP